jgi:uncharacterized protein (DUF924 family)
MQQQFQPGVVLDLWFPDTGHQNHPKTHGAFWEERMQGGMDAAICERFGPLTEAAARGLLDDWAETPRGRLALILALDQFPRSLWRGTPGAYAQDIKAARLALEGLANGHYDALPATWERAFYTIAISHCEGPEHLERLRALDDVVAREASRTVAPLEAFAETYLVQHERVKAVIARFGRHPHRNAVLGRLSTPEEEAYIATGDFPHLRGARAALA